MSTGATKTGCEGQVAAETKEWKKKERMYGLLGSEASREESCSILFATLGELLSVWAIEVFHWGASMVARSEGLCSLTPCPVLWPATRGVVVGGCR